MKDIKYYEYLGVFDDIQMIEIHWRLKENLDVSIYAKPVFNDEQMNAIRKGLQNLVINKFTKFDYKKGKTKESDITKEVLKNVRK